MATNGESWKIVFYQDGKGKRPVQEFLDGLSKTARAAVLRDLDLLKEFRWPLRMIEKKLFKKMTGLFELI